ncbi:Alpha/Beta hydrolase fold [Amanita muscaria]
MNNVYFPSQVATLLRRLANLVSTISISNHYFLNKSESANHKSTLGTEPPKESTLQWFNETWSWRSVLSSLEADVSTNIPSPSPRKDRKDGGEQNRPPILEKAQDLDVIHKLLQNPALCDPLRTPRYPLVLCHGLYGFDTRGPSSFPSMRMHYWANVLSILRDKLGAEVIVTAVPGQILSTGSVPSRSESLDRQLHIRARGRGVNFLAHSMGGLDCRYLISHIKPTDYTPLSLTTISTPHRGSPFMDWCAEHLGLGRLQHKAITINAAAIEELSKQRKDDTSFSVSLSSLPSSFTTLILSILDSPAYANLTSNFLNDVFNPTTPDDPSVKYFSVAGRMSGVSVWHPFWLPKLVLDSFEEDERSKLKAAWESSEGSCSSTPPLWAQDREWGNDGLVTIQSAKWGEFLGIMEECDHWQMRGARGIEFGVDLPNIPALNPDWSFRDWSRFTAFWSTETKSGDVKTSGDRSLSSMGSAITKEELSSPASVSSQAIERSREREREIAQDDAIIKSSTDKLSAVVDFLTEQVPSIPKLSFSGPGGEINFGSLGNGVGRLKERVEDKPRQRKSELETKKELERFYIALCRKIYDEGL